MRHQLAAHVGKADARAAAGYGSEARAIVKHSDLQQVALAPRTHQHVAAASRLEPVFDRVLDQRDEQHRRKLGFMKGRFRFD